MMTKQAVPAMLFDADQARLRQRQLALRLRSAELRAALRQDALRLQASLQIPLRLADRGFRVWSWWRALRGGSWPGGPRLGSMALLAAGVALFLWPSSRRLLGRAGVALGWLRLLRRVLGLWRQPATPPPGA